MIGNSWCPEIGIPQYDLKNKQKSVNDICIYMINRLQQIFEYDGLDDEKITFTKREIELLLQLGGHAIFAEVGGKLYAFWGSLGGIPDAYYMPTISIVANPFLKNYKNYKINENCIVISNDSLYRGLKPILSKYATLIVESEISLNMFAQTMRTPVVFAGDTDTIKESAELFIKHLLDGNLEIVSNTPFLDGIKSIPFSGGVGSRITDLIEYRQYLWATMLNELGLKASYNMKREALSDDEVAVNDLSLMPLVDNMLECRRKGLEKVNEMFGTNISVRFASAWEDLEQDIENDLEEEQTDENSNRVENEETEVTEEQEADNDVS